MMICRTVLFSVCVVLGGFAWAAQTPPLQLGLSVHTQVQRAAFFKARGLASRAIDTLDAYCFVHAQIQNTGTRALALDLSRWHFFVQGRPVARAARDAWSARWDSLQLSPSDRAVFDAALLPETRDLQPGESVAGYVILPPGAGTVTLEAGFLSGAKRRGGLVNLRYENLSCLESAQ